MKTLETQIACLDNKIRKAELEIDKLSSYDLKTYKKQISKLWSSIEKYRKQIRVITDVN